MADAAQEVSVRKNARLMISYSRKDKVFVKQLHDSLLAQGFASEDIWVDWEGIPLSADWMVEITKGIQGANAFIFVVSPDSVTSDVCKKEIDIAAASNKRFIPVLYRELPKGSDLHEKISSHNWVFIRDEQELEKTLPALVEAINTDLDWLAEHTRWQNRALEWDEKGRNDSSLVRGNELQEAEAFLGEGAAGKEPAPTQLHVEYVQAARKLAVAIRRRNRVITAVVGVALLTLSVFALVQWANAAVERDRANNNAATAVAEKVRADDNAATAQANEVIANQNARAANSLALASESINQKGSDTQLALMLALLSIQETKPDGTVLIESQSALFSSLNTPNVLYTLQNNDTVVWSVAYDPTGKYFAVGDNKGLVRILDALTGQEIHTLQLADRVSGLDFSPDGRLLGTASWDGTAKVWDAESGKELLSLVGHNGVVNDIKFSPDGKLIATAGEDALVKIWYANTGTLKVSLPSHEAGVTSVDFGQDGTRLVSGSEDDTVILWNVETSSLMNKFRPDGFDTKNKYIQSVAFSPGGDRIIASGYQTVVVWSTIDYSEIHRLRGNQSDVWAVAFAPDGLSMLTASSGVKIWDTYNGTERYNLSSHRGEVTSAAFSKDGNYILTGSWDSTAKLWTANLLIDTLKLKQNVGQNLDANYSSDGKSIVVSDGNGNIIVYDAETGETVTGWNTKAWTSSVSFDPKNRQRIVSGDDNGQLQVWLVGQDAPAWNVKAHDGAITSATFSPDGSKVITTGSDKAIRIWDAQTGNSLGELSNESGKNIFDARFSDDGSRIVTANEDKTAQIWDAASGKSLLTLTGHTDYVLTAVFSHDGKYVYTGGYDSTIRKWDVSTGELLLTITGHTGRVLGLDVSPDDSLLASGSADTTVRVWDVYSGKEIFKYLGNNEDVNSVAFNHDGTRILTASSDETTKEFTIDYDSLLKIAQQYELRPLTKEECQRFLYQDDCTLTLFGDTPASTEPSATPQAQPTPVVVATEQPAQVIATNTSVPALTDTPQPAQSSSGQSSYTEEFNGNLNSWSGFMTTGIDSQVNTNVTGGSLVVKLSPYEDKVPKVYLINNNFDYSNVQVEMVTTNNGNNANGVSLICGYSQSGWYEFAVSNAGLYAIFAYDPSMGPVDGYIQLASGGSAAIKNGKTTNTYTAVCKGNELTLSINGTLVKTITDTKYNFTNGKIGIGVSSPQTLPVDVSIDSLIVNEQ